MFLRLLLFLAALFNSMGAVEQLDSKYCISFGEDSSPQKMTVYFSFSCPHCAEFFQEEFPRIKSHFIDSGELQVIFHPVPIDMPTLWSIACLEKLSDVEKRVFLEAIILELDPSMQELSRLMIKKLMAYFKKDSCFLDSTEALAQTENFQNAYRFISQEDGVKEVPLVEVNGRQVSGLPSYETVLGIVSRVSRG